MTYEIDHVILDKIAQLRAEISVIANGDSPDTAACDFLHGQIACLERAMSILHSEYGD